MSTVDFYDLGQRIRELRRAAKLTQGELAAQCGVSASFMGHIERGTRVASVETLVHICNTLHVTPQYLLSASLNTFDSHIPEGISAENRARLTEFLRLAQDTLANWN